jgi:hypothetical protein
VDDDGDDWNSARAGELLKFLEDGMVISRHVETLGDYYPDENSLTLENATARGIYTVTNQTQLAWTLEAIPGRGPFRGSVRELAHFGYQPGDTSWRNVERQILKDLG